MRLTATQISQFEDEGYLLLRGVLSDRDLDLIVAEYEQHIDCRAEQLLATGKITDLHAGEPFDRRLPSVASATRSTRISTSCASAAASSSFCATTTCSTSSRAW